MNDDLIERAEQEAGCRWDDPDNPGALAILFGALARELNPHSRLRERDDYAAGLLLMHQMSEEGQQEQRNRELLAQLLLAGLSPDDVKALLG